MKIRSTSGLYWNAYKISRVVFFNYTWNAAEGINATAGAWTDVATITDLSFAPTITCDIIINNNSGNSNNPASLICICRFYPNGRVMIWPYVNNPYPHISHAYISVQ